MHSGKNPTTDVDLENGVDILKKMSTYQSHMGHPAYDKLTKIEKNRTA